MHARKFRLKNDSQQSIKKLSLKMTTDGSNQNWICVEPNSDLNIGDIFILEQTRLSLLSHYLSRHFGFEKKINEFLFYM